ncbi:hypothetical protein TWF730_007016 [Orbilia blumenaviensis]|uniref:Uncharacterized protein n=1 Tax=Orbilia blumenaviensis TaxID=1796055 RepID=A0AAV9VG02_9PEZI
MQIMSIILPLAAFIASVVASPALVHQERDTVCSCDNDKRDVSAVAEPALIPVVPVIDTANTPNPSRDNCLKQLEQYGAYADARCAEYGAPVDLINSYRGKKEEAEAKAGGVAKEAKE